MAFSWFPGKSSITYTHSIDPLILPSKSGPSRALPELVKDVVPECNLNPLLFNGHLQTFWTASNKGGPPIHYKRRVVKQEDERFPGHFSIDFAVAPPLQDTSTKAADGGPEDEGLREDPSGIGHTRLPPRTTYFSDKEFESIGSEDQKPLLIALHGLSGGSYEVYLRHVLAPIVEKSEAGEAAGGLSGGDWEALVVNSRGCAGSKITTGLMYNARATWDVRQVVKWCRKTWPKRKLFAVGFSLGANILTNYLGEEGENCLLSAAVVISNPWKLEVTSIALRRSYIGLNVYSKAMGESLRKLFNTHADQITHIDREKMQRIMYLHEFDREVQCKTWGYPTEDAYYRDASSADSVLAIRIPTLCLHARDDPIANDIAVPHEEIKQNPYVVMCTTAGGGHLSWFEWGGGRWHAKPANGFLRAMNDIDTSKVKVPKSIGELPANPGGYKMPFEFEPMRRKCHLPGSIQ